MEYELNWRESKAEKCKCLNGSSVPSLDTEMLTEWLFSWDPVCMLACWQELHCTEMLRAEFLLSSIVRRGGLIESWEDLDGDLWTIWLPEGGIRVSLPSSNGQATAQMAAEMSRPI